MTDTHIKIKPVVPKVQYTGNGVTTDFPYTFAIFDETDMIVYLEDEIIETGYSVTGAGETDGGYVIFDTAPEDGVKITLLREVPIERMTDFQEGGAFRAKNINDDLDRQTAFVQQLQEKISRAMIVPPTSEVSPETVLMEVSRIYESIDNIDALADDKTNLDSVAESLENINALATDKTNIDAVASNISDINSVASNASNINTLSENIADVSTVSADINNINTVAENISEITDKANKDMDNLSTLGKQTVIGFGMPDYSAGTTISTTFDTVYAPTKDGIFILNVSQDNASVSCHVQILDSNDNILISDIGNECHYQAQWGSCASIILPLPKGNKVKIKKIDGVNKFCAFYPMKGA